tara:strand:- start:268 stop:864 length:597 start_codon:yes stop_codon:yes gene_type:complete
MTSREGYDAYTLYLGIKLHFYSEGYDFVKYNGKVKADINSFGKRKDKYHFGKLSRKYKQNLQDFYIANLSVYDLWAGDLLENECEKRYMDWKKRQQKLTYMFETEVNDQLRKYKINTLLKVNKGQHPRLLKAYLGKEISLETLCIMDEIIGFTQDWIRLINEKVVYPEVHNKINKYKSFLTYPSQEYKNKLIEICSTL